MDSKRDHFAHVNEGEREVLKQYLKSVSSLMNEVLAELRLYAPTDLPVVIEGESGTGKEMFVSAMHALSRQAAGPYVAVSMGEGPDTLFESALFGHRKGAFTGAEQSRQGYIEQSDGGTLYFDEINSLGMSLQPKLLRVLETRSYRPIGAVRTERTSARFVFSSNESLQQMTLSGRLRMDLFYRMGHVIRLPSLRERKEDIPFLTNCLLVTAMKSVLPPSTPFRSEKCQKGDPLMEIPDLAPGVLDRLQAYAWPGNIRQLKQVLERALLLAENGCILPEHLNLPYEEQHLENFGEAMERFEETYFSQIFGIAGNSIRLGIKLTGMSETSYRRKFRKYGKRTSASRDQVDTYWDRV